MSNLDQVIQYTKLFQDMELATAMEQLKKDPSQLQLFLQGQQDNVYKEVVKKKDDSFQKLYGDLTRVSQSQEASLMLNSRNKELEKLSNEVYAEKVKDAKDSIETKHLAGRKYEMNEWSINNKKDTLFVYSLLFILLAIAILVTALWRMRIIGTGFWVAIIAPLLIIFTFTVVNRSQYTDIFRNKRYWNRRTFKGSYGAIPVPICPGVLSDVEKDITGTEKNVKDEFNKLTSEQINIKFTI